MSQRALPRPFRNPLGPLLASLVLIACSEPTMPTTPSRFHEPSRLAVAESSDLTSGASLVLFRSESSVPSGFSEAVEGEGGEVVFLLPQIGMAVVRGLSPPRIASLVKAEELQGISPDPVSLLDLPLPAAALPDLAVAGLDPASEPFFPLLWGLRQIEADRAIAAGFTGQGARVGILDTGIFYDHPDLAPNFLGGANFFAPFCDPAVDLPSACDPDDPLDDNGHGTGVAGIVAAAQNGFGVLGVAPDAKLIAAKVCGRSGSCPRSAILAGIVYLADQGVHAINVSLGGFVDVSEDGPAGLVARKRAAKYALQQGALIITIAGNGGLNLDRRVGSLKKTLGQTGNVMVVSALGPDELGGRRFGDVYTNVGHIVDVAAPGGSFPPAEDLLFSTNSPLGAAFPGQLFGVGFGTSGAAPHVTGAAAQIVGAFGPMNPNQIRTRIRQTADDLGEPGNDPLYGQGRVNVWAAVTSRGGSN